MVGMLYVKWWHYRNRKLTIKAADTVNEQSLIYSKVLQKANPEVYFAQLMQCYKNFM
jgi:hypothetical protein